MARLFLEPILHDKYTQSPPTVDVVVADVADSHPISDVVRQVNKLFPNNQMKHLKKIRHCDDGVVQVLLAIPDLVSDNIDQIKALPISNMKTIQVPSQPPLTRSQFAECKILWPCSFHEDKYIRKCLDGKRFDSKELSSIHRHVDDLLNRKNVTGTGVTLIVGGDDVLAAETDNTSHHPLHHSAVLAINSIANQYLNEKQPLQGYICTSFDAFLSEESCLMCSMALLHSRIKRIFFLKTPERKSACPPDLPFTRMKLHLNEMLNHRFEVWSVTPEKESEAGDCE